MKTSSTLSPLHRVNMHVVNMHVANIHVANMHVAKMHVVNMHWADMQWNRAWSRQGHARWNNVGLTYVFALASMKSRPKTIHNTIRHQWQSTLLVTLLMISNKNGAYLWKKVLLTIFVSKLLCLLICDVSLQNRDNIMWWVPRDCEYYNHVCAELLMRI